MNDADKLRAELEELRVAFREAVALGFAALADHLQTKKRLRAVIAARNELVAIAKDSRWTSQDPAIRQRQLERIEDLGKVGQ